MLYVAFVCSLFITAVASSTAFKELRQKPRKWLNTFISLAVFTIPFVYLANEVFKRVF